MKVTKEIITIDDLQSELQTLKSLLGVAFWMVRELPYPEDEDGQRDHDELTAIVQIVKERISDLDASVERNYSALGK
ncbi:hypothetical protein [Neorhizobium sp. DT-125]|uniref:hypothetical protein n=1 Tax=Neorhizobium sp. DT-125 TaxID=3396163 RepID=UPI003F1DD4C8